MKRIDPFDFYQLAIHLRALRNFERDCRVSELVVPFINARHWLNMLLNDDPIIELRHSGHSATQLRNKITDILKANAEDKEGNLNVDLWENEVPSYAFSGLQTSLDTFEHNFAAEMREAAVYFASQVGLYNTGDLVDQTELHIPTELRASVNDNAIDEIKSAGRCLAFSLPTACGFHILRAAESVLEDYYGVVSGNPGKKLNSWNDYAKSLEKLAEQDSDDALSRKVIRSIRQIKDLDRNPIMHPRDVLSEADAMILFSVATSAIAVMAKGLLDADGQSQLQLIDVENNTETGQHLDSTS